MSRPTSCSLVLLVMLVGCTTERRPPPAPAPVYSPAPPECPACPICSACPAPPPPPAEPRLTSAYGDAKQWQERRPLTEDTVTCEFQVFADAELKGRAPEVVLKKQAAHQVLTFVGMKGKRPKLKGSAGTTDLERVMDNGDQVVLIERNKAGSAFVYAISRAARLGIWTKANFMPNGSPFARASVGLCY